MIENTFRAALHYCLQKFGAVLPEMSVQPILITGTHRGGTTFVGTILAEATELRYVYESLSPWFDDYSRDSHCAICGLDTNIWYPYIHTSNESPYLVHFKHFNNSKQLMGKRPLYKEPLSPFAAEWMHATYNARVVFILRNPLALVASCKQVGWHVPFERMTQQSELLETYLPEYKKQALDYAKTQHSIVQETALLYNMVYEKAYELSLKYPNWIFVKHEEISAHPEREFRKLYEQLGLRYTQRVAQKVNELTSDKNAADSDKKNIHALYRKSQAVSELWRKRLTQSEIDYVVRNCKRVAALHGYTI